MALHEIRFVEAQSGSQRKGEGGEGLVLWVCGVIEGFARFRTRHVNLHDDFYTTIDPTADSDDTCHPHSEQPSGFHTPRVPGLGF